MHNKQIDYDDEFIYNIIIQQCLLVDVLQQQTQHQAAYHSHKMCGISIS